MEISLTLRTHYNREDKDEIDDEEDDNEPALVVYTTDDDDNDDDDNDDDDIQGVGTADCKPARHN